MPKTSGEAGIGLRLTLPGAPLEPHVVLTPEGGQVPGLYAPCWPTPVGGPGELTEEQARRYAAEPSIHLEVVAVPADDVEPLRQLWAHFRADARRNLVLIKSSLQGGDVQRAAHEVAAITATEEAD